MNPIKTEPVSLRRDRLALALAAFLLYGFSLSKFPFPGDSVRQLVEHTGIAPFPDWTHPLWGLLAQGLVGIHAGTLALRLGLLSASIGAAVIALFHSIICRLGFHPRTESEAERLVRIGSFFSAAALAILPPMWWISSRAHPAGISLLLFLGVIASLQKHREHGAWFYFAAILAGIGVAECAPFLFAVPLLAALFWSTLPGRKLDVALALVFTALLSAALLSIAAVLRYRLTPAFSWREFSGVTYALRIYWHEQITAAIAAVPRQGWLLVIAQAAAPFCYCLFMTRRRSHIHWRTLTFHSVIIAAVLLMAFDAPVAVWSLLPRDAALVAPCLFIAASFGFSVCFFRLVFRTRSRESDAHAQRAITVAIVLALVAGTAWSYPRIQARRGDPINRAAVQTIRSLGSAHWLFAEHSFLPGLLAASAEEKWRLFLIDPSLSASPAYRRYVANTFADPRKKSIAGIGVLPLLNEWFGTAGGTENDVAIMAASDLWRRANLDPLPAFTTLCGARNISATDAVEIFAKHERFWSELAPALRRLRTGDEELSDQADAWLRQMARVANDLGVLLENKKRPDLAQRSYEAALQFQPGNLSAALNLTPLLEDAGQTSDAADRWKLVAAAMHGESLRVPVSLMFAGYGGIARTESLRRVGDLRANPISHRLDETKLMDVARLYTTGDRRGTLHALRQLTQEMPENDALWMLMGLVAHELNDTATLQTCFDRMKKKNDSWAPLQIVLGERALADGQFDDARRNFDTARQRWPFNPRILEALVQLDLHDGQTAALRTHLHDLLAIEPMNAWGNYALGLIAFDSGENEQAELAFQKAIAERPFPIAHNNLAWLLQARGLSGEALFHARTAVELAPEKFACWDTLAIVLMRRGEFGEAAGAMDRAAALAPVDCEILLHRAELDARQNHRDEARKIVASLTTTHVTLPPRCNRALQTVEALLASPTK